MQKRRNRPDNETTEESKAKNMTYYDVLGVYQDAVLLEIKKQFRKLAVKYHPDNRESGDASIFALVARAYECLSDEQKREEYDRILAIEKKARKSDYISQKKAFEEFIKAQETDISTKTIDGAKSKFRIDWEDMDRKRGTKTLGKLDDKIVGKLDEKPLSSCDALKRLKDIEMEREQDEIEFSQPEIFTTGNFNRETFNKLWEYKYKQNSKDDQLVKHGGAPTAFNDVTGSSFISCEDDGNYDAIFDDNGDFLGNDMYGSIKDTNRKVRVCRDDIDKVKGFKSEYSCHNVIDKDYQNDIEKRLREREMEDKLYDKRKLQDFDTDKGMGGYGFSQQAGLTGKELEWDREEFDDSAIKRLMSHRQSENRDFRHKIKKH